MGLMGLMGLMSFRGRNRGKLLFPRLHSYSLYL
jgi:hypothetical protein